MGVVVLVEKLAVAAWIRPEAVMFVTPVTLPVLVIPAFELLTPCRVEEPVTPSVPPMVALLVTASAPFVAVPPTVPFPEILKLELACVVVPFWM